MEKGWRRSAGRIVDKDALHAVAARLQRAGAETVSRPAPGPTAVVLVVNIPASGH